jgi:hypothetical protein
VKNTVATILGEKNQERVGTDQKGIEEIENSSCLPGTKKNRTVS